MRRKSENERNIVVETQRTSRFLRSVSSRCCLRMKFEQQQHTTIVRFVLNKTGKRKRRTIVPDVPVRALGLAPFAKVRFVSIRLHKQNSFRIDRQDVQTANTTSQRVKPSHLSNNKCAHTSSQGRLPVAMRVPERASRLVPSLAPPVVDDANTRK
jgi:hypothetical protein